MTTIMMQPNPILIIAILCFLIANHLEKNRSDYGRTAYSRKEVQSLKVVLVLVWMIELIVILFYHFTVGFVIYFEAPIIGTYLNQGIVNLIVNAVVFPPSVYILVRSWGKKNTEKNEIPTLEKEVAIPART